MTVMTFMNAVLENISVKASDWDAPESPAPSIDNLTGLLTKTGFMNAASKVLARGGLVPSSYAAISVKLDNLSQEKVMQDMTSGGPVIKEIAHRIRTSIRAGDLVARTDDDEFTILMPNVASEIAVLNIASRIQAAVCQPIAGEEQQPAPSLTIGITITNETQNPLFEEVLYRSDKALHEARLVCRGAIHLFDSTLEGERERREEIEQDLRNAVANNELLIHYQPIYDIKNSVISHLEALVRWQHPELGLVPPTDFISVAESNGTIEAIGNWVLRQAFQDAHKLDECGMENIDISVNLSFEQLTLPSVVEAFEEVSRAHPQHRGRIALEVTQDAINDEQYQIAGVLEGLRDCGFKIFLDNFGTEKISLEHLQRLAPDAVKIDRSLLANIDQNQADLAIVRSILNLADGLNLSIIAQGVESLSCLQLLVRENCRYAQGYYVSRPLPFPEAVDVIQQKFETAGLASALSSI